MCIRDSRVTALAQNAMADGDYRWSSDLLQQLVFADPKNGTAKSLLADSYEQQGYQSESAIWRNQFLVAAKELRDGPPENFATQSPDLIAAVPTQLLLDSTSTRFDPKSLGREAANIQLEIIDRGETASIEANGNVLIGRVGHVANEPDVIIRGPRQLMLAMLFLRMPVAQLQAGGLQVEGDASAMQAVIDALDPMPSSFPILTP